jgi:hypothetical protein
MNQRTYIQNIVKSEQGSALLIAIMVLLLATIIGFAATTTTSTELGVSGNDKMKKVTFYEADGGTEAARELTELNFACAGGFKNATTQIGMAEVVDNDFWAQHTEPVNPYPTDTERDIRIPANDSVPHTNITVFGNVEALPGGAVQMAAAYEKKGKALAEGGSAWLYEIHARNMGLMNAESTVRIQYRHVIGTEGDCLY